MGQVTELRMINPPRGLGPDDVIITGEAMTCPLALAGELGKLARGLQAAGWAVALAVEAGGEAPGALTLSLRRAG